MTLLAVYDKTDQQSRNKDRGSWQPSLLTRDAEIIQQELMGRGIGFERWDAKITLESEIQDTAILNSYAEEIRRVQRRGGYETVDTIRMTRQTEDKAVLRQKFLAEHTHSEDEVRFFVEGKGLFCLHLEDAVLQIVCERNDWIALPAGTRHWFDMGENPTFCAIRFFNNPDGWVANFTRNPISKEFPMLEELLEWSESSLDGV